MSVRCESEGANGPQFWIEQFCVVTHYPPRFFSRCKSTHFEALWIPPREQHSWVRGVGVRLSSGFEASDYAAKKTDANKRLLFDKVTFVDSLRRLRWDNVLVSTETSVSLIPFSNFKFSFKRIGEHFVIFFFFLFYPLNVPCFHVSSTSRFEFRVVRRCL
jgi:hypothetical protein